MSLEPEYVNKLESTVNPQPSEYDQAVERRMKGIPDPVINYGLPKEELLSDIRDLLAEGRTKEEIRDIINNIEEIADKNATYGLIDEA